MKTIYITEDTHFFDTTEDCHVIVESGVTANIYHHHNGDITHRPGSNGHQFHYGKGDQHHNGIGNQYHAGEGDQTHWDEGGQKHCGDGNQMHHHIGNQMHYSSGHQYHSGNGNQVHGKGAGDQIHLGEGTHNRAAHTCLRSYLTGGAK